MGLKWWICWSVGGSFGLIIGSSGDDFWVFSTAWVSNRRRGFVDRWLCWWFVFVCGFVVVGLWLKWLVILGFRWVSDGLFFFSSFCCDAGFFFLVWVFVSVGFLWAVGSGGLGFSGFLFRWVCVWHCVLSWC